MLTPVQAAAIVTARRLQVRPVPGGWVAETAKGGRLRLPGHPKVWPTWEEAAEGGEATLAAAEGREREAGAARVVAALARGRYFVRPRTVANADPGTGQRRVFDALRPDNSAIAEARGCDTFVAAVIAAEAALGA